MTTVVEGRQRPRKSRTGPIVAQVFLITVSIVWLIPIAWAFFVSLRPYADTSKYGYVSWPHHLNFQNYYDAWNQGDMGTYFWNSVKITVPAVIVTLFIASMVAFILSRSSRRLNVILLILFTAGNLLPPQVLIVPLYQVFLKVHVPTSSGLLYNSTFGLIVANVIFQVGFCVFVLSNYMKSIPTEMYEAAVVDGAGIWTRYWRLTMPLCRPALAALATLLTTWIYNDFFWAITLVSTGNKRPITAALDNLQGEFLSNQNLLAAAAIMAAIPTLIVYVLLQKQFIAGLSLGSSKG